MSAGGRAKARPDTDAPAAKEVVAISIRIAPYEAADARRMVEIAPPAFGVWARYGIDRSLPRDRVEQLYRDEIRGYARRAEAREDDFAILVARDRDAVVGYVVVGVDAGLSEALGLRWGRLISLAVDPPRQGEGIGPRLAEAAMDWFRRAKCDHVEVWTDVNNIAAIRTYEGVGFRVIYSGVALSRTL